ncbi:delta-1-pyrroline-5-carboxylate dehydrogenase [Microsporum canis CBS 113480]|uniref:Multifunctional fusion protein n=1 Tax=Arthroderma otae (strain ATCC MYA-4605 / CBS 113480) TaxID=554155 RepID=C5FK11_ARTOC|nr:delta-1-pyrroline-5-carboxylate dehydrogenase [Microsporum canis CBS 113480]EEQ30033.1 delta-1-pyrroline-5-carboxylate dehydrogenase [Microsporum canis CBS 113480]
MSSSLLSRSARLSMARQPLANTVRYRALSSFRAPTIVNEPNQHYARGSEQRQGLQAALQSLKASIPVQVPYHFQDRNPSAHAETVAKYFNATEADVSRMIEDSLKAKPAWESLPFADRAAVFLKAADLVAGKYRYEIMAATMLGQGKNAWQAEIDAAAELADFLRFNVQYAEELYTQQPEHHAAGVWNRSEYRPLEGFVYAISPFNFTAIGGNLAGAPALMGNVVLWKPSPHAVYANYLTYKILLEAGLPKDVIQFVPGDARMVTRVALAHRDFAGLHYTGSTAVFRELYGKIGQGIAAGTYRSYPRVVGETGGKNFHLIHSSADIENAAINTVRGAFEFQGQKCSATSRAYVPQSRWAEFREILVRETEKLKIGPPEEFANFIGPVIHEASFNKLAGVIDAAKQDKTVQLLTGGRYDKSQGYYVHPTVLQVSDPEHDLMKNEFFGPVLAVYVYDDAAESAFGEMCKMIDRTTEYGLTGAVFAQDRAVLRFAEDALRHSAGNFYLNVKSTGAVVGQQAFGGARASGTNDKAGSANLLTRFVNIRSIKEDFVGCTEVEYPSNK